LPLKRTPLAGSQEGSSTVNIVVAATRQPHALSRKQVEAVFRALPDDLTVGIQEVWLETGGWYPERCEYDATNHRLRLNLVVPEKTAATTEKAVRLLLEGLVRRKAGGPFYERVRRPVPDNDALVNKWLPLCLQAAS
jgi:hypothetical protein